MAVTLNTPDYRLTYNQALAAVPGHLVGREGVPDLTHPLHSYLYLEKRRQVTIDSVKQRPLLRLWDGSHRYLGQIAQAKVRHRRGADDGLGGRDRRGSARQLAVPVHPV